MKIKNKFLLQIVGSVWDLTPIFVVILTFQTLIIRQPIPNILDILEGTVLVILGLALFIQGLEKSLFPIGESMAYSFASKGSLFWLLLFLLHRRVFR